MAKPKKKSKKRSNRAIPRTNYALVGIASLLDSKNTEELRTAWAANTYLMNDLCSKVNAEPPAKSLMFPESHPMRIALSGRKIPKISTGNGLNAFRDAVQSAALSDNTAMANEYFQAVLTFSMAIWSKNRLVYAFQQDAVDFIESDDDIFDDQIFIHPALHTFDAPCVVTFPDGSGFMYAMTNMENVMFESSVSTNTSAAWNACPVYFIRGFGEFKDIVTVCRPGAVDNLEAMYKDRIPNMQGSFDLGIDKKSGEKVLISDEYEAPQGRQMKLRKIWRSLIYLNHILRLQETERTFMGFVSAEKGSPAVIEYTVPGMQANWNFAPSIGGYDIAKYGIHPYFGFLTASTMRSFTRNLPEKEEDAAHMFGEPKDCELFYLIKRWVEHGSVFSVSADICTKLWSKYNHVIDEFDWVGLIKYLPMDDIVIYEPDLLHISYVSKINKMHLYINPCAEGNNPCHRPYFLLATEGCGKNDNVRKMFCILAHICLYYKVRAERQEALRAEIVAKEGGSTPKVKSEPKPAPVSREGYDVNLDGLLLFDVTAKAVKKLSHKERALRYGWKMPTHIRRAHKHRFWVGSGENRHLEERWVESMIINKDEEPSANIHTVK